MRSILKYIRLKTHLFDVMRLILTFSSVTTVISYKLI